MRCPTCEGGGRVFGRLKADGLVACPLCGGSGEVASVSVQCAACDGGVVFDAEGNARPCRGCDGSGLVPQSEVARQAPPRSDPRPATAPRMAAGTRRVADIPGRGCPDPAHLPPQHLSYEPGVYEHECPRCGARASFRVDFVLLGEHPAAPKKKTKVARPAPTRVPSAGKPGKR